MWRAFAALVVRRGIPRHAISKKISRTPVIDSGQ
ncbi:hypothetical protein CKAH01_04658 [Colletotrichum kahawae]|uniref:Uncharacterized protein n=1 Tax=Colletotrichum kahawae TaxID=34407 RepID=A0AAD9YJJ5_COLKA|nr:hypothetical protein CKAH01_04658 [Colletotrichum kahawae]